MAAPSLMGIPPECRIMILRFVLTNDPPTTKLRATIYDEDTTGTAVDKNIVHPIMLTCHKLRNEAFDSQCIQGTLVIDRVLSDDSPSITSILTNLKPSWYTQNITTIDMPICETPLPAVINKKSFPRLRQSITGMDHGPQMLERRSSGLYELYHPLERQRWWEASTHSMANIHGPYFPKSKDKTAVLQRLAKENINNVLELQFPDTDLARDHQISKRTLNRDRGFKVFFQTVVQIEDSSWVFRKWVSHQSIHAVT